MPDTSDPAALTLDQLIARADALIFDCDGTLADSASLYARAWAGAAAAAGASMEHGWYHARNGLSAHVLMDAFEAHSGTRFDRAAALDSVHAFFMQNIDALTEVAVVADIARAARGKLPLAVASGGSGVTVLRSLDALGLRSLFDTVVTLDDVDAPKPAPDLFLHAARRLAVAPGRCLVFEDSEQGMQAAAAAGMCCVDVRRLPGYPR